MKHHQTKLASAVEAVANTLIGLTVAFAAQNLICWAYSIKLSGHDNAIIVAWMTVISVIRSYCIRRLWNNEFWRNLPFLWSALFQGGGRRGN